jgi:HD-GYP domain-containing protein (c-di-GMP phosphodiesterase class II)
MKFCINDLLFSISFALDLAEGDLLSNSRNHNMRVALVSGKLGRQLGLKDTEIFDLVSYALLHDVGVVNLKTGNYSGNEQKVIAHCIFGEEMVKDFPFLEKRENIILYHHETNDGTGCFGKTESEIPLFSKIISFSDYFESLYRSNISNEEITLEITNNCGERISMEIANAWLEISKNQNFWLDINDLFIEQITEREIPKIYLDTDFVQIRKMTKIFSTIVDSYSPFTGNHSSGISEKAAFMADYYRFDQEKKYKLMISADLHDIGKLGMPNEILDKNGKLSSVEFAIIKKHTYLSRRILEKVDLFNEIVEWASNHHEKLNGTGYPYGFGAEKLDFCSRLMGVIDIYQALTEDRPYRLGMDHKKAMGILNEMVEKGEIDGTIVKDIGYIFGEDNHWQNDIVNEGKLISSY